jgi:hypothetical protein
MCAPLGLCTIADDSTGMLFTLSSRAFKTPKAKTSGIATATVLEKHGPIAWDNCR